MGHTVRFIDYVCFSWIMRLRKSWSGFPGCSLYLIKSVVSGQLTSQSLCEVEVVSVHSRNVHWVRKTEIISLPWLMIILYFTLSTRYIGWPGGSHFSLLSKRTRAKYLYFCVPSWSGVWCHVQPDQFLGSPVDSSWDYVMAQLSVILREVILATP